MFSSEIIKWEILEYFRIHVHEEDVYEFSIKSIDFLNNFWKVPIRTKNLRNFLKTSKII